MKSIFQIRSMHLQGDGLYTALLIKVFAYLLALRLQAQGVFSKLTITEIMRKLRREEDLRDFLPGASGAEGPGCQATRTTRATGRPARLKWGA